MPFKSPCFAFVCIIYELLGCVKHLQSVLDLEIQTEFFLINSATLTSSTVSAEKHFDNYVERD